MFILRARLNLLWMSPSPRHIHSSCLYVLDASIFQYPSRHVHTMMQWRCSLCILRLHPTPVPQASCPAPQFHHFSSLCCGLFRFCALFSPHLPSYGSTLVYVTSCLALFMILPPAIAFRTFRLNASLLFLSSSAASLLRGSFALGSKKMCCQSVSNPIQNFKSISPTPEAPETTAFDDQKRALHVDQPPFLLNEINGLSITEDALFWET